MGKMRKRWYEVKKAQGRQLVAKYGSRDAYVLAIRGEYEDKFWAKVSKTKSCWLYHVKNMTYGKFATNCLQFPAHRVALLWATGKPMTGYLCCHKCNRKTCVNPEHLYWGLNDDNMKDITHGILPNKGLARKCRGFGGLLKNDEAKKIFCAYHKDGLELEFIAQQYNISLRAVRDILTRKHWASESQAYDQLSDRPVWKARRYRKWTERLQERDVIEILECLQEGHLFQHEIASLYGVSEPAINHIAKGRTWKRVVSAWREKHGCI